MPQFAYRRLDDDGFRLLMIKPGDAHSTLEAELTHATLTTPPSYHALSYTWGSPEPAFYMKCDGTEIRITKSLHDALCQLREQDGVITVWADAICINQRDDEEKSRQVARMREIYSKAESLFIWLGYPAEPGDAELAIDTIGVLEEIFLRHADANHLRLPWPEDHRAKYDEWDFKVSEEVEKSHIKAQHWKALGQFYLAPWFSRVWIFQEAVSFEGNPRSNMAIAFGTRRVSWDSFAVVSGGLSIFRHVFHHLITYGLGEQDKFPWFITRLIQLERNCHMVTLPITGEIISEEKVTSLFEAGKESKLCASVSMEVISQGDLGLATRNTSHHKLREVIDSVMRSASKLDLAPVKCTLKFVSDGIRTTGGFNSRLFHHLNLGRRLSSTDPRDKLFAFYGVLQSEVGTDALLAPDYGKSVIDVFIDITLYFIQRESCLDIFELLYDQPRRDSMISGLPSWANDWTQTAELEKFHTTTFSTGGGNYLGMSHHALGLALSEDRRRLGLQVYVVGAIRWHVPPKDEFTYEYVSSMTESGKWDYHHCMAFLDEAKEAGCLDQILNFFQYTGYLGRAKLFEVPMTSASSSQGLSEMSPPSKRARYHTGETLYEAFWRTLVCNLNDKGSRAESWEADAFEAYHKCFEIIFGASSSVDANTDNLSQKFQIEHNRYTRRRRFCVTDSGFMGWAPRRAAVGDAVCVIPGARMPYVIRQSCEERKEWELIGHAYIHGLMEDVVEDKEARLTEKGRELLGEHAQPVDIWLI
ncbi:heterokaryon incompatibility protein-domain-containing protein [Hypoxylon sp. FL1857]|nr:heterokaryon incompatibility protein-domain-containing protein [Hypoxylon sp. FL1857]